MIKKTLTTITFAFVIFFLHLGVIHAMTLDSIGSLVTSDQVFEKYWYNQESPTLKGTSDPTSNVTFRAGTVEYTSITDASGNWTITPTLAFGAYNASLSSETEMYPFTLTLDANVVPAKAGIAVTPVPLGESGDPAIPDTGADQILYAVVATLLIFSGYYLYEGKFSKRDFEKAIVRD